MLCRFKSKHLQGIIMILVVCLSFSMVGCDSANSTNVANISTQEKEDSSQEYSASENASGGEHVSENEPSDTNETATSEMESTEAETEDPTSWLDDRIDALYNEHSDFYSYYSHAPITKRGLKVLYLFLNNMLFDEQGELPDYIALEDLAQLGEDLDQIIRPEELWIAIYETCHGNMKEYHMPDTPSLIPFIEDKGEETKRYLSLLKDYEQFREEMTEALNNHTFDKKTCIDHLSLISVEDFKHYSHNENLFAQGAGLFVGGGIGGEKHYLDMDKVEDFFRCTTPSQFMIERIDREIFYLARLPYEWYFNYRGISGIESLRNVYLILNDTLYDEQGYALMTGREYSEAWLGIRDMILPIMLESEILNPRMQEIGYPRDPGYPSPGEILSSNHIMESIPLTSWLQESGEVADSLRTRITVYESFRNQVAQDIYDGVYDPNVLLVRCSQNPTPDLQNDPDFVNGTDSQKVLVARIGYSYLSIKHAASPKSGPFDPPKPFPERELLDECNSIINEMEEKVREELNAAPCPNRIAWGI